MDAMNRAGMFLLFLSSTDEFRIGRKLLPGLDAAATPNIATATRSKQRPLATYGRKKEPRSRLWNADCFGKGMNRGEGKRERN